MAAAVLLTGCIETIPLGRECPDQLDSCIDAAVDAGKNPRTEPTGSIPPVALDASAADQPDAGAARRVLFPELRNASFDAEGAIGSLTDDDRVLPWMACSIGWSVVDGAFVQRPSGSGTVEIRPTDGETFLENVITPPDRAPLYQRLPAPLARGQRYAFRVDAWSASDVDVSLELWAGPECQPTRMLDSGGRIPAGRWQSVCLSFEVPTGVGVDGLMLITSARDVPASGTRVFFDHVREDPSCL